ncbi:MAG TPA: hypothetical protein VEB40_16755 [Flavipsychrobacter sp.]|nr:hypothetical protein [Flavipsychrobacter sp.]
MKKYIYILGAISLLGASSCERNQYTCQCTNSFGSRQNLVIYASSLGKAEDKCARQNGDADNGGSVGCHVIN